MKSIVRLSRYSTILTIIINGALLIGCFTTITERPAFYMLLSIFIILLLFGCLYGPIAIKANSNGIAIKSILNTKNILMRDVKSVERFRPTMGTIRICASGGYMGYWGIFREGDIGQYTAFYGKASDCFLICLKNGDKYVLGCESPDSMVDYIKSQIK